MQLKFYATARLTRPSPPTLASRPCGRFSSSESRKSLLQTTRPATLNISSPAQPDSTPGRQRKYGNSKSGIRLEAKRGLLTFTQHKGRNRKPKRLTLPILPALQRIIDGTTCGDLTFLVNDWGRPFTDAGFGNWFRDRCVEAGVPGRAHGLRKAGATIAANNGATSRQLMAIFGWDTLKEAERYTRGADQLRLAEAAMHMLEAPEQNGTVSCPTEGPGGTFLEKE